MDPQNPISEPSQTIVKTRAKTRVITAIAALGLAILAAVGAVRSTSGACDSGSQRGRRCTTNRDCRTMPGDRAAQCVRRTVRTPVRTPTVFSKPPMIPK